MRILALLLAIVFPVSAQDLDLSKLSTSQLLSCFGNPNRCGGINDSLVAGWAISDELASRGHVDRLLAGYRHEKDPKIRAGIVHVAYHFDTPLITAFMKSVFDTRTVEGEELYWPVNYLAKKCDREALRELSTGRYRTQGSLQYQNSLTLFGKCGHRAAIPYLVNDALYDASLNVVDAAAESLSRLYPERPKTFASIEEMQTYFCRAARKEGFAVLCRGQ